MMKKLVTVAMIGMFGLGLTACAGNDQKETGGAVIGGVIGGLLGSQIGGGKGRIVSSAAGAALGVFFWQPYRQTTRQGRSNAGGSGATDSA